MFFFFISYSGRDKNRITVIDLSYAADYERSEFNAVTEEDYYERNKAIIAARALADMYGKEYVMFESRYDSNSDEYLGEF